MTTITSTELGATGRYINLGSPASQDDIGVQTIIVYAKPTGSGGSGFAYLFAKTPAGSISGPRFFITHNAGAPQLCIGVQSASGGGPSVQGTAGEVTYGAWAHFEATWDGTQLASGMHVYVSGVETARTIDTNGSLPITADAANDLFLMNRGAAGNLGREFVGDYAYVARWSRILNSTERANVRTNGPLAEPTGLILCWANGQDYSASAISASARSTYVAGSLPPNTALGGAVSGTAPGATLTGTATITPGAASGDVAPTIILSDAYERSSVNLAGSSVSGLTITIKPRVQESEVQSSQTGWLEPSAKVTGVNGINPTFKFTDYASGWSNGKYIGAPWQTTRRAMYSYDRETWYYFTNSAVSGSEIVISNATAFAQDTVYVSRSRQFTVTQAGAWCAALQTAHPSFVGPTAAALAFTPSATTSWPAQAFICDEFAPQPNELGATIPACPLYAFEINDASLSPAGGGSKRVAIFTCGVHAGEDHANYILKAFIEYLCGSSAEAQAIRREYRVLVYPIINAPGRSGGGWRGSFTQGLSGADDANRHFSETNSLLQIVDKPKAAQNTDQGADPLDIFIDFHGDYGNAWGIEQDAGYAPGARFMSLLGTYFGSTILDVGDTTTGFLTYYFKTRGAKLSIIHETGDPVQITDTQITNHGVALVNTIKAMMDEGAFFAFSPGATLTGTATLSPGAASGQSNATAPGATITGTASLAPGAATGASAGSAPGATLTGNATLSPGAASGQSNASAPGATLTGSATLNPGSATGGVSGDAVAPSAALTGTATLTPGAASGTQNASAPGAALTGTASLTPGAAIASSPHAAAPGATLTGGASLIAGRASDGSVAVTPGPDIYRIRAQRRNYRVSK